jgi:hypothetical protein
MGNGLKEKLLRPKVENEPLIEAIQDVCQRMEALDTQFAVINDNDLMEACIYEMEALRAQYRFLLRKAKETRVSGSSGQKVLWEL